MKRRLAALLVGLGMLAAITVTAQPAQAATLWHCPGVPYAWVCTRVIGPVNVLDRQTGNTVTWQTGTSVGLMYWTVDNQNHCAAFGVLYVWSVVWKDTQGNPHWAVIGDGRLQTGTRGDWGPTVADAYGNTFDPTYHIVDTVSPTTACNTHHYDFLDGNYAGLRNNF